MVFNWQVADHLVAATIRTDAPKKPEGPVPEAVTRVIDGIVRERILATVRVRAIEAAKEFGGHSLPTRSLTGRLELMLRAADSIKSFCGSLEKLRSIAKENLKKCWNGNKDLLAWLQGIPDGPNDLSEKNLGGSEYVAGLAPVKFQMTAQFREVCARVYLESFFAVLRKMKGREK